jgi:hypothetical protein
LGKRLHLFLRSGQISPNGDLPVPTFEIQPQRGFQPCQRQFIDAERASEGVLPKPTDGFSTAEDQARLRAAQQLVAAGCDEVRAVGQRLAQRPLVRQTIVLRFDQASASDVVD